MDCRPAGQNHVRVLDHLDLICGYFQGMFGYVSKVYFSGGSRIEGLAAMGLDFLGLHSLFGTVTMNGTWWYMSAAVIFVILVPLVMKMKTVFR